MKERFKFDKLVFAVAVLATAIAAGCATTSAPLRSEATTSGIRAAEEVGAAKVPQAALHLQLAKEGFQNAKNLAAEGKQEQAESMLSRAEADAELAVVLWREDSEKLKSRVMVERVVNLRQDNQ